MEYNRGEMKREVKEIMRQTRPNPLALTALFLLILLAGSFAISKVCGLMVEKDILAIVNQMTVYGWSFEDVMLVLIRDALGVLVGIIACITLCSILSYLWIGIMGVGYEGYSLSLQRGENPGVERLFCAFPQFGSVLLTRILVGVFVFLWGLLLSVGVTVVVGVLLWVVNDMGIALVLLPVLWVAVVVAALWIILRYAFADYALLDDKLGAMDAIRRSKQMTKGNKGKIFVLLLSFLGWELLKCVIVAVGMTISMFTIAGQIELETLIYLLEQNSMNWWPILRSVGAVPLIGVGLAAVGCFLLDLWLTPYRAASVARLYDKIRIAGNYGESAAAPVAAAPVGTGGPAAGPGATVYPTACVPPTYPSNPSGYGAGPSGYGATPPAYNAGGQAYGANQTVTPPSVTPPTGQSMYSAPPYSAPAMPLTPAFSGEALTVVPTPEEGEPAAPVIPVAPTAPAAPVEDEVPTAPAAPVVHEEPMAPAAPVVHEEPEAPADSAAPAAPEEPRIPPAAWSSDPNNRI